MISDSNYGFLDKIGWSRSSRTDKGVHAAGVVVSLKMLIDGDSEEILDEHVQSVNEEVVKSYDDNYQHYFNYEEFSRSETLNNKTIEEYVDDLYEEFSLSDRHFESDEE